MCVDAKRKKGGWYQMWKVYALQTRYWLESGRSITVHWRGAGAVPGRKLECGNPNVDEGLSTGIGSMIRKLLDVEINELVNFAGLVSVGCLGKRVLCKLLV